MEKASESSSRPKKTTRNVLLSVLGVSVLIALIVGLTVPVGGTDEEGGGGSVLSNLFNRNRCTDPCVPGTEDLMSPKAHGTSEFPVVRDLRSCNAASQQWFVSFLTPLFSSLYIDSNRIFSGDATLISPTESATSAATMPNFLATGKPLPSWRTSNRTLTTRPL